MGRRRKKCRCCRELFPPHPQTYRQQITCDKAACRRWRIRRKWRRWSRRNPLYGESRRAKLKGWREAHGAAYMRRYRRERPAYAERNRRLQRQRDLAKRNLVKPTEWSRLCREKSKRIRALRRLVKPTEWPEVLGQEIDGIWRFLGARKNLVKPTAMA